VQNRWIPVLVNHDCLHDHPPGRSLARDSGLYRITIRIARAWGWE